MRHNKTIIPYLLVLLIMLVFSSCQTLPIIKAQKSVSYPPQVFSLKAIANVVDKGVSHRFNLVWIQTSTHKWSIKIDHMTLPWELHIADENGVTWVNNQIIDQDLNDYLVEHYQFNLPIDLLKNILFFPISNKKIPLHKGWKAKQINTQLYGKNQVAKKILLQNVKNNGYLMIQIHSLYFENSTPKA